MYNSDYLILENMHNFVNPVSENMYNPKNKKPIKAFSDIALITFL